MSQKRKAPTVAEKLHRELVWVAEHPERCQSPWRTAAELASWIGVEVEEVRPLLETWVQEGTVEVGLKGLPNPWTGAHRTTVPRYRLAKDRRPLISLLIGCRCTQEGKHDWQRLRHYQLRAQHYDTMYRALTRQFDWFDRHINATNPQQTIDQLPSDIPRDRPPEWYREQAEAYQQKADQAQELHDALRDMAWKTAFERMSQEEQLAAVRDITERIEHTKATIREWEAKIVPYEIELAQRALRYEGMSEVERLIYEQVDRLNDPATMVETFHHFLPDDEEKRAWMLAHLSGG